VEDGHVFRFWHLGDTYVGADNAECTTIRLTGILDLSPADFELEPLF
jgi:hypothetical protein